MRNLLPLLLLLLTLGLAAGQGVYSPCDYAVDEKTCLDPKDMCYWCKATNSCERYFCGNVSTTCPTAVFEGHITDCRKIRTGLAVALSIIGGIVFCLLIVAVVVPCIRSCRCGYESIN